MNRIYIEKQARLVQYEIWHNRETLFPLGIPSPLAVFQPDIAARALGVEYEHREELGRFANRPFAFDHASLERDPRTWHVTTPGSTDHIGRPPTLSLGEGRVPWFGMSVAGADGLRVLRKESVITAEVHPSDSRRRAAVLNAARENMEFPMLSLNTDVPPPTFEGFLHFGVIVGPKVFPDYRGPEIGFPFGSPYVVRGLTPPHAGLSMRSCRIALSDTIDIQITCAFVPGRLKVPIAFTAPSNG